MATAVLYHTVHWSSGLLLFFVLRNDITRSECLCHMTKWLVTSKPSNQNHAPTQNWRKKACNSALSVQTWENLPRGWSAIYLLCTALNLKFTAPQIGTGFMLVSKKKIQGFSRTSRPSQYIFNDHVEIITPAKHKFQCVKIYYLLHKKTY